MHVHGVFPYIFVPFDGIQPVGSYLQQFADSLDKAINIALGQSSSTRHHVYKISLVSGMYVTSLLVVWLVSRYIARKFG